LIADFSWCRKFMEIYEGGLSMKIAVTGATGNLGYHAVNGLLEKLPSQDVIAVVRDETKAAGLAQRGTVVRVAAYGDPDALIGRPTTPLKKGLTDALLASKNA
jgi:nucleoside-diphosphate-sugar epimerase